MKIKTKVARIKDKLFNLYSELAKIQEECPHENVKKEYHGSTGNYDRSQDCHWIQLECPDCGKKWCEDR